MLNMILCKTLVTNCERWCHNIKTTWHAIADTRRNNSGILSLRFFYIMTNTDYFVILIRNVPFHFSKRRWYLYSHINLKWSFSEMSRHFEFFVLNLSRISPRLLVFISGHASLGIAVPSSKNQFPAVFLAWIHVWMSFIAQAGPIIWIEGLYMYNIESSHS